MRVQPRPELIQRGPSRSLFRARVESIQDFDIRQERLSVLQTTNSSRIEVSAILWWSLALLSAGDKISRGEGATCDLSIRVTWR
jgi:hypothetical protein